MSSLWAKMARARCQFVGQVLQDVQVGQDGSGTRLGQDGVPQRSKRASGAFRAELADGLDGVCGESPIEDTLSVQCQGGRCWGVPAKAVRVAWERYVGEIGGESPTFLHADLTLRADPAVSAQFEKNFQVP